MAGSHAELKAHLNAFGKQRVLVLGDMVADEYLIGRPARISREAPVLILHFAESFVRAGGATNTAYNIRCLGARTAVVGVIGDDELGRRLRQALDEAAIDTTGLIIDKNRPTSAKTRVLAKGTQEVQQQIVRIDRIDETAVEGPLRDRMIEAVRRALSNIDAVLISDYENGVISQEVLDACLPELRKRDLTVTVDSHGDLFRFKGVTAATPNQPEAEGTVGHPIRTPEELSAAGEELLHGMETRAVLITRGSEGLALFEPQKAPYVLPVAVDHDSQVVDPTGAGDTVAAVFTLAVASGAGMRLSAYLANLAGGEVVRKLGAAAVTTAELEASLEGTSLPPPDFL